MLHRFFVNQFNEILLKLVVNGMDTHNNKKNTNKQVVKSWHMQKTVISETSVASEV